MDVSFYLDHLQLNCAFLLTVSLKFYQYQVEKPMASINSKIKIFFNTKLLIPSKYVHFIKRKYLMEWNGICVVINHVRLLCHSNERTAL